MNQIIKENLERRFSALLEHKNEPEFVMLELDYIEYIGRNKVIGNIIKDLIKENRIYKKDLQHIYSMFMTITALRQVHEKHPKIIYPSFYDKKIEKTLTLHSDFIKMIYDSDKEYKKAKKEGWSEELTDCTREEQVDLIKEHKDLYVVQQIHNNIMEKLTEPKNELIFREDGKLLFLGKEILISKSKDSDPYYLLKTLFKDREKLWNYDEIAEDWGNGYEKNSWSKYYNAGYKVNEKVAKETTIKDFLELSRKAVSINKKYI